MIFDIFKDTIIAQNHLLLKEIAEKFDLEYDDLVKKYITPSNYLPVILNTQTQAKTHNTTSIKPKVDKN